MPTPDMKGKEVIYWIKIRTGDKRFATELSRFMDGAPKFIDLRVPSALIAAKTEIESFRPVKAAVEGDDVTQRQTKTGEVLSEKGPSAETEWRFEIVLRRTLSNSSEKQTQSPYG